MWFGIAGLVLSLCAVVVAVWSARGLVRAEQEALDTAQVTDMYADFRRLTELRLDNWQHAHLLEPPGNYSRTKKLLKIAITGMSEVEIARHLIQERAVAIGVFQLFEQTLYQLHDAAKVDARRLAFYSDVLAYMTSSLFLNPRLLYLWSKEGGCLSEDFEESTKAYYDAHVVQSDTTCQDSKGLFDHDLHW